MVRSSIFIKHFYISNITYHIYISGPLSRNFFSAFSIMKMQMKHRVHIITTWARNALLMGLFSYSYYTKRDFWHMIKFEPLKLAKPACNCLSAIFSANSFGYFVRPEICHSIKQEPRFYVDLKLKTMKCYRLNITADTSIKLLLKYQTGKCFWS